MQVAFAATDGFALMEATFSPPFTALPADSYESDGIKIYLVRDSVRIDERIIGAATEITPPPAGPIGPVSSIRFFRRRYMAAISVTLANCTKDPVTGTVYIDHSDGSQTETSIAAMTADADGLSQDVALAKRFLHAALIRDQPTLNNAEALNGSTCSIDTYGEQMLILTRAGG